MKQGRSVSVHFSNLCSLPLTANSLFAESHSCIKAEKCKASIYVKTMSSATIVMVTQVFQSTVSNANHTNQAMPINNREC